MVSHDPPNNGICTLICWQACMAAVNFGYPDFTVLLFFFFFQYMKFIVKLVSIGYPDFKRAFAFLGEGLMGSCCLLGIEFQLGKISQFQLGKVLESGCTTM